MVASWPTRRREFKRRRRVITGSTGIRPRRKLYPRSKVDMIHNDPEKDETKGDENYTGRETPLEKSDFLLKVRRRPVSDISTDYVEEKTSGLGKESDEYDSEEDIMKKSSRVSSQNDEGNLRAAISMSNAGEKTSPDEKDYEEYNNEEYDSGKSTFMWKDGDARPIAITDDQEKNDNDANEDDEDVIEALPPSFWHKLKTYATTRVPVICKLYSKYELVVENLISTYLHVAGLSAHKALKKYCAKKLAAVKPVPSLIEEETDIVAKESPSKLSRVISWINAKLQEWAKSGDDTEEETIQTSPPAVADETNKAQNLVFYPKKLNLVLFPPSLSSVNRVLSGEEESDSDKMSADDLREELWQQMQQAKVEEVTEWVPLDMTTLFEPLVPNARKMKRSCIEGNCPGKETPVREVAESSDRNLKDLNDLAVVISGFDRSPIHFMMGNADSQGVPDEELKSEENTKIEEETARESEKEMKVPEKALNAFGIPVEFNFPGDDAILNLSPKFRVANNDKTAQSDFPILPERLETVKVNPTEEMNIVENPNSMSLKPVKSSGLANDFKELSFANFEKTHSLSNLPHQEGVPLDERAHKNILLDGKAHTADYVPELSGYQPSGPQVGRMPPADQPLGGPHPDISIDFKNFGGYYFNISIFIIFFLLGVCVYLTYKKKESQKYDMTRSTDEIRYRNRMGQRMIDISVDEASDIEMFDDEQGPYDDSGEVSPLQEKGNRKTRKESYESDYQPVRSQKGRKISPLKDNTSEAEMLPLMGDSGSRSRINLEAR